jgi:Recombinase zinc beta ribbon domain
VLGARERGEPHLGDLSVGDQLPGVRIDDGAGVAHRHPRVLGDGGDRSHHHWVLRQDEGELGAFTQRDTDHRGAAIGGVPADQDRAGRPGRAGGPDRLPNHARRALPRASPTGAEPDPGDYRRAVDGADRGGQRGQSPAQHLLPGDLGVAEAGALFGLPVDRPQQRIDIHKRPGLEAGQQPGPLDQGNQVPPRDRRQLQAVAMGELPRELAQRRRRVHPAEQPRHPPPRGTGGGPAREGAALLQGLIRCGRCGRTMQTGYSGTKGNCPRYVCARAKQLYGGEKGCQSLGGRRLEQRVLAEVFAVLAPAALEATIRALRDAEAAHEGTLKVFTLAVERARFEADRARRQYDAVEPENRLVARTLERALEAKLAAQRQAERDLLTQQARRPVRLTEDELSWLSRAGADVKAIFEAPTTSFRDRKQLLRAILTEVVVTIDDDKRTAAVVITWQGGSTTELTLTMNKNGGHARATDEDTVAWSAGSPGTTTTPPSP